MEGKNDKVIFFFELNNIRKLPLLSLLKFHISDKKKVYLSNYHKLVGKLSCI